MVDRALRGTANTLVHLIQSVLYLVLALVIVAGFGGLVVASIDLVGRRDDAPSVWPELHDLAARVPGGLLAASLIVLAGGVILMRVNDWAGQRLSLSTRR